MDIPIKPVVKPMNLLTIKDNSEVSKDRFSDIKNLTNKIADKTLNQLEQEGVFIYPEYIKDSEDLTWDQMILKSKNNTFFTSNAIGYLGYGNERLVIKSRFGEEKEDYFFKYLLEKVLDVPNLVELNTDTESNSYLFNFLLFLFPNNLKKAMRKGLFKKYILNEYNNKSIKGVVDIARHIKQNTPFIGNIAYNQREFSYDNHLMELVRHTIEFIKRKPYGNKILNSLKSEIKLVIEATPNYRLYDRKKIIETNKNNTIKHAYFREYLALQRLCILILQHQKHQIGTGVNQIYGILFDGAWLWEEYINTLIKDFFYHPMNRHRIGAQHLFDKSVGLIYPDFISKDNNPRIIADAKYKPYQNIKSNDYMQVLTYMYRFDANIGYYLYPEDSQTEESKELWLNSGITYENNVTPRKNIRLIKHGLKIPAEAKNYESFVLQIRANEYNFQKEFIKK